MCGIYGVLALDGSPVDTTALDRMDRWLAHRGPDGRGSWSGGPAAFGHRLLAIVAPPDEGRQPIVSPDGAAALTYNGELYDFAGIRDELAARGHRFRTTTDSEVMLAAYREWGIDGLQRFDGMWAAAIWDQATRTLHLSRDRFGVKPLYYAVFGGRLYFASSCAAIGAAEPEQFAIDPAQLARALTYGPSFEAGAETLFSGIRRVPPGHRVEIRPGEPPRLHRWWRSVDHLPGDVPTEPSDQVALVRERLLAACRRQLPARVPTAVSVSGGIDSGSLACLYDRLAQEPGGLATRSQFMAVSAVFPDSEKDETEYARTILRQLSYRTEEIAPSVDDLPAAVEASILHSSDLRPMHAAQWIFYRALSKAGFRVSVDGHGADELFSGYPRHFAAAIGDGADLPTLRDGYANALGLVDWTALLAGGVTPPGQLLDGGGAGRDDPVSDRGPFADLVNAATGPNPVGWIADDLADLGDATPLDRRLYAEFHATSLPAMLNGYDEMAMAHGIEVRVPFTDRDLVTLALALPGRRKIWKGFTKAYLRAAMQGILPREIVNRRLKLGFGGPKVSWLAGPLRDSFRDAISGMGAGAPWHAPAVAHALNAGTAGQHAQMWPFFHAAVIDRTLVRQVRSGRPPAG